MSNIALIVLDTLRKDTFDEHFDWLPGKRFENAWATAHYTVPSHASFFTGKYPSEIGVHAKSETLSCDDPVLSEALTDGGYQTRSISGNMLASPVNEFDRGFNEFYFTGRAKTLSDSAFPWKQKMSDMNDSTYFRDLRLILQCALSDYDFFESVRHGWHWKYDSFSSVNDTIKIISDLNFTDSEFLFVNLMDAHAPYSPPEEYRSGSYERRSIKDGISIESQETLSEQKQAYEDSVRFLSDRYRQLFSKLKEDFEYIITVSDHGELFGEHGTSKHYYGVYPELTHVPLVIYTGTAESERISDTVSLLDVHRTILDIANVDSPSRGQDLLNNPEGRGYLTECHGLRTSSAKSLAEAGTDPELLDKIDRPLRGFAAPDDYYGYQSPYEGFVQQGIAEVSDPKTLFDNLVQELEVKNLDDENNGMEDMSEDVESQLRDLGYM